MDMKEKDTKSDYKSADVMDFGDGTEPKRPKFGGGGRKRLSRDTVDPELAIDYKNLRLLQSFVSEHGKITPRRISGNDTWTQHHLTRAIKRARHLALLGFTSAGK